MWALLPALTNRMMPAAAFENVFHNSRDVTSTDDRITLPDVALIIHTANISSIHLHKSRATLLSHDYMRTYPLQWWRERNIAPEEYDETMMEIGEGKKMKIGRKKGE